MSRLIGCIVYSIQFNSTFGSAEEVVKTQGLAFYRGSTYLPGLTLTAEEETRLYLLCAG
jgi:hypothetical protein